MEHTNFISISNDDIDSEQMHGVLTHETEAGNTEDSLTFSNPLDSPCLVPAPYFTEISSRALHTASPPVGRTSAHLTHVNPNASPLNLERTGCSRPRTDSGFCSWTGTAESQQKFFPALMKLDSEENQDISNYFEQDNPLSSISHLSASTPTPPTCSNAGHDLSRLPCANALNEELTDRMFVCNFEEIMLEPALNSIRKHNNAKLSGRKDRFKLSPDVLLRADGIISSSNSATNFASSKIPPHQSDENFDRSNALAFHHSARRRPDSVPLYSMNHHDTSRESDNETCAGHEGDDENDISPESQRPCRRIRRNTHPYSQKSIECPNNLTLPKLDSNVNGKPILFHWRRRQTAENRYYRGARMNLSRSRIAMNNRPGDECSSVGGLNVASIPDVVPRQVLPSPLVFRPRHSVTFFHSPLIKFSPLTRQRSLSYPFSSSDLFSTSWYSVDNRLQRTSLDYVLLGSVPPSERLSLLANRMAEIGDDLEADFRSSSWSIGEIYGRTRPCRMLSFAWRLSSSIVSVLTVPLDCAYRIMQMIGSPIDDPNRLNANMTSSRRRRTLTYSGIAPINHRFSSEHVYPEARGQHENRPHRSLRRFSLSQDPSSLLRGNHDTQDRDTDEAFTRE